jgi:hypothetical protein
VLAFAAAFEGFQPIAEGNAKVPQFRPSTNKRAGNPNVFRMRGGLGQIRWTVHAHPANPLPC